VKIACNITVSLALDQNGNPASVRQWPLCGQWPHTTHVGMSLEEEKQENSCGPEENYAIDPEKKFHRAPPAPSANSGLKHSFSTSPCLKSTGPIPRSPWLTAHPHIYVCLLSVFRSPLNCALASQTPSPCPETQREWVIKFPHQTARALHSWALQRSCAVAQSKMLGLVNMSYNIIICLWGQG